jgi:hypothetical protein
MQEQATMDYIRNVFVKYLIYMAKKSEKETKTLEKVLFTVLNIPSEQEKRVERARKKTGFWNVVGMFKRKGKTIGDGELGGKALDSDINFTLNNEADYGDNPLGDLISGDPISFPSPKKPTY